MKRLIGAGIQIDDRKPTMHQQNMLSRGRHKPTHTRGIGTPASHQIEALARRFVGNTPRPDKPRYPTHLKAFSSIITSCAPLGAPYISGNVHPPTRDRGSGRRDGSPQREIQACDTA